MDENSCWIWLGSKDKDGYGKMSICKKDIRAHRFSFYIYWGFIKQKLICHSCDNPSCVNPNHLWIGTHKQNRRDCVNKKRTFEQQKTHCPYGHKYTKENTYYYFKKSYKGKRQCKLCWKRKR